MSKSNQVWFGSISEYVNRATAKGRPTRRRKVSAANSNKTKATNRQKPKRRKR